MSSVLQDIRFGLRMMRKNVVFTIVAVLTLALGIGANTAIFSVVNAAMLRPLPFPNARRLMSVYHSYKKLNMDHVTVSPSSYRYYREHATTFDQIAAFTDYMAPQNMTGNGDPQRVKTVAATGNFFATLGSQPMLGRTFNDSDDSPGAAKVAVLSYGLWSRRFGGEANILGRDITLDGMPYTVIGVMPKGFEFPEESELWVPIAFTPKQANSGTEYLNSVATLKPGVSPQQAVAEMEKITQEVIRLDPDSANVGWSVTTEPLQQSAVSEVRTALLVLLAAVGCVLLIACANVANLLLARASARQKEVAIRTALGASRWRMIRQLLVEGILLSLAGSALGLLLSYIGLDALLKLVPVSIPPYIRVGVDWGVLLFTLALVLLTALIFSAVPALQLTRTHVNEVLKEGGRSSATGGKHVVRAAIVVAQLALAVVLLVGAGLLIKTFMRIQQAGLRFNPDNVLTFVISLPEQKYKAPEQMVAFFDQVLERERHLPGVQAAALTTQLPLTSNMSSSYSIEGRPLSPEPHGHVAMVGPDYFSTIQTPLISGRAFTDADRLGSLPVAVIDEKTAKAYFPGEDPTGKKIMFTFEGTKDARIWRQIVGVVASVKHSTPLGDEQKGQVFLPFLQSPQPFGIVVMRTSGDPMLLAETARRAVLGVDPQQPVEEMRTMDEVVGKFVAQPRFNMVLLAIFAALALVLSAIGVYGVMAYSVTQRTHEFGVRMALGASRANVLRFVLAQALRMTTVGLVAGLIGAFVATRALRAMLFGVKTNDPATFIGIAALLAICAVLASYLPARRATKVDPMVALRYE